MEAGLWCLGAISKLISKCLFPAIMMKLKIIWPWCKHFFVGTMFLYQTTRANCSIFIYSWIRGSCLWQSRIYNIPNILLGWAVTLASSSMSRCTLPSALQVWEKIQFLHLTQQSLWIICSNQVMNSVKGCCCWVIQMHFFDTTCRVPCSSIILERRQSSLLWISPKLSNSNLNKLDEWTALQVQPSCYNSISENHWHSHLCEVGTSPAISLLWLSRYVEPKHNLLLTLTRWFGA